MSSHLYRSLHMLSCSSHMKLGPITSSFALHLWDCSGFLPVVASLHSGSLYRAKRPSRFPATQVRLGRMSCNLIGIAMLSNSVKPIQMTSNKKTRRHCHLPSVHMFGSWKSGVLILTCTWMVGRPSFSSSIHYVIQAFVALKHQWQAGMALA